MKNPYRPWENTFFIWEEISGGDLLPRYSLNYGVILGI